MEKALVILSGGQDSTTCLAWAKEAGFEVHAVTYDYGQRHVIELESAIKVAHILGAVTHDIIKVGPILQGSSPLVSQENLDQYPDMFSLPGGLEKTFVPGRNLLFLTLAANHAYARGITHLVTGVCQEDFGGYPDCRQVFIDAAQDAIRKGFALDPVMDAFGQLTIHTPLMNLSKADSIKLAKTWPLCWAALAYTHTAYDGKYPPTGHDHATLLRAKGFFEADLPDPLILRAVREGLMPMPTTPNYDRLEMKL